MDKPHNDETIDETIKPGDDGSQAREDVQLAAGIHISYDRESRTLLAFVPPGVMTIVIGSYQREGQRTAADEKRGEL